MFIVLCIQATRWINIFTSLGGRRLGYERARVTPYMHSMVYHVPRFMEKHQGIKKFTGQGKEMINWLKFNNTKVNIPP